jgi:hypothetical protein
MQVTMETSLDSATIERLLAMYRAGFDPIETLAAARQSLTDDEFRAEMVEPSVLKFVGWNRRGEPVALMNVATDLDHVVWISSAYFAHRYPEHAARNAIWYVGALVLDPAQQGGPWMRRLSIEVMRRCAEQRAVVGFDCSGYNAEVVKLPRMLADVGSSYFHMTTELVDTQHYYAYTFEGTRGDVDLRPSRAIDLTSSATTSHAAPIPPNETPERSGSRSE